MNPVAILLLLVGYLLSLPIAAKIGHIVATGNRLAVTGHQIGLCIACIGWVVAARPLWVVPNLVWALIVAIWFNWRNR